MISAGNDHQDRSYPISVPERILYGGVLPGFTLLGALITYFVLRAGVSKGVDGIASVAGPSTILFCIAFVAFCIVPAIAPLIAIPWKSRFRAFVMNTVLALIVLSIGAIGVILLL